MNHHRRLLVAAAALLSLGGIMPAFSQQFPSKAVKVIVPTSPGTSTDAIARTLAEPLSIRLKVPVVVENKSGAGGLLGYTTGLRAPPDGYTIVLAGLPRHLLPLNPETTVKFDPLKDFTPIARVARTPLAIVVRSDAPYRNLAELIDAMRAKPDGLTYSSQGVGSTAHLCGAALNDVTKTKAKHVAYKETALAVTDLAGGVVTFSCQGSVSVLSLIQSGKLRALAVTSSTRWKVLPDVPTVVEAGFPNLLFDPGIEFVGPAGMPAPIVQTLADAITEAAQTPKYKDFLAKAAISHEVLGPKAFAEVMPADVEHWKRVNALAR